MALVLLLLLVSSFTVFAQELETPTPTSSPLYPPHHGRYRYRYHNHHHHHPPAPAPVYPPPTPYHYPPTPVKPPRVPVHPPVHPLPRSSIAVQGVVFVKSCKYAEVDTLWGATPVLGAIVKLQCNTTKYKVVRTAKTDKNGYFFLEAPKTISTFGAHKCRVVLVSAPTGLKPSNLHGGVTGAILRPEKPYVSQKVPFQLYAVGPLAFEPKCYY